MPPPADNSSQESTFKTEPGDPPCPTPVSLSSSRAPSQPRIKRERDESDGGDTEEASAGRAGRSVRVSQYTMDRVRENLAKRISAARNVSLESSQHTMDQLRENLASRMSAARNASSEDSTRGSALLSTPAPTGLRDANSGAPEATPAPTGSQFARGQSFDPFNNNPAYGRGPRLRFNQLDDYQKRVVESAVKHRRNICSVGGAGTGKSGTCEIIMDELRDLGNRVVIVAPSGTSAVNVCAQTLHSFYGLGAQNNKGIEGYKSEMKPAVRERLRNIDTLVIDEISMVSCEMFDRMDQLSRAARGDLRPFGGIQVIVFGDFCQLPPVKPQDYCYECGGERKKTTLPGLGRSRKGVVVWQCVETAAHRRIEDGDKMWAFQSLEWASLEFEYLPLNQFHRQADVTFLTLLNKLRHGKPYHSDEIDCLQNHPCEVTNAVKIVPLRADAYSTNNDRFDDLPGKECRFMHQDKFVWQRDIHPELADINQDVSAALSSHAYERWVCLKVNQPVILQKNLDIEKGLINGSQGVILRFVTYDEARQPRDCIIDGGHVSQLRRQCIDNFMRNTVHGRLPVVKFNNMEAPQTIYPDCSIAERGYKTPHSLLIRTQIPLLSGWALTIHKTQGMTLDKAIVDVGRCFVSGMAYVALSRVKNLEGLKVEGLDTNGVIHAVDDKVKEFLQDRFGENFD